MVLRVRKVARRQVLSVGFGASLIAIMPHLGCGAQTQNSELAFLPKQSGQAKGPKLLVLFPEGLELSAVWNSLVSELEEDFLLVPVSVPPRSQRVAEAMVDHRPDCVIVFDNTLARDYRDYQRQNLGEKFPPVIVLMSAFVEQLIPDLKNAMGISYEVPVATSVPLLRSLISPSIERVGVLYREGFQDFVARQFEAAKPEKFELVGVEVSREPGIVEVRRGLRHLIRKEELDALWVLNDSTLLQAEMLREAWLPATKSKELPVIVGVSNLLSENVSFGTIAIEPEPAALGLQAANLVYDLQEDDWQARGNVDFPFSMSTTLDAEVARQHFGLRENAATQVSRTVRGSARAESE